MNGNQLSKDYWAGSDQQQATQWLSLLSHKTLLKEGDQSVPTAYWNLTASKVPHRDPGSLEKGFLQSESKKATAKRDTMRTLGQPAMEARSHLRFNCWGQRKEKGRKTKWQNWTVHQELRLGGSRGSLDRGTNSPLSPQCHADTGSSSANGQKTPRRTAQDSTTLTDRALAEVITQRWRCTTDRRAMQ